MNRCQILEKLTLLTTLPFSFGNRELMEYMKGVANRHHCWHELEPNDPKRDRKSVSIVKHGKGIKKAYEYPHDMECCYCDKTASSKFDIVGDGFLHGSLNRGTGK